MMKLTLIFLLMFFFMFSLIDYLIFYVFMLIFMMLFMWFYLSSNFYLTMIYNFLFLDLYNFMLLILMVWLMSMVVISSLKSVFNFYMKLKENKKILFIMIVLSLILFNLFCVDNLLMLYIYFEISLILMFFMIMGGGKFFYRLEASIYMFMYTFSLSLPFLLILIKFEISGVSLFIFNNIYVYLYNLYIFYFLLLGFMVKLPIYLLHLWLPKAHVEASVGGSMILAGVMLKLSGYVIIRLLYMYMYMFNLYSVELMIFSLIGGVLMSLVCIRQLDMKILVAYSSIVHMSMMFCGLISLKNLSLMGGLMMMISHGILSSALFSMVNLIYERSMSRSLLINKGLLIMYPSLSMLMFILCINNMSSPPSLSLLSEFFLMLGIMNFSFSFMYLLVLLMFFSSVYMIYLFMYSQLGNLSKLMMLNLNILICEFNMIIMHLIPLNFLFFMVKMFME